MYLFLERGDDALFCSTYRSVSALHSRDPSVDAYVTLGEALMALNRSDEAFYYCKKCIEAATKETVEETVVFDAYLTLAKVNANLNKRQDTDYYLKESLTKAEGIENNEKKMLAYLKIALFMEKWLRNMKDAVLFFSKCIELGKFVDDKTMEMHAYISLTEIFSTMRDSGRAAAYAKKALELGRENGAKFIEKEAAFHLAYISMSLNPEEAVDYCIRFLSLAKETGDKKAEWIAQDLLACHHVKENVYGNIDAFRCHMSKNIDLKKINIDDLVNETSETPSMLNSYKDKLSSEDLMKVREIVNSSEEEIKGRLLRTMKTGTKLEQCNVLGRLKVYYEVNGQYEKAIECLEQLSDLDVNPYEKVVIYRSIAEIYAQRMGKIDKALSYCEQKLPEVAQHHSSVEKMLFFTILGTLYQANFQLDLAEKFLRKAIQWFDMVFEDVSTLEEFKMSIVDQFVDCYKHLSIILMQTNRFEEAILAMDGFRARALQDQLYKQYGIRQDASNKKELRYSDVASFVNSETRVLIYSFLFRCLYRIVVNEGGKMEEFPAIQKDTTEYLHLLIEEALQEICVGGEGRKIEELSTTTIDRAEIVSLLRVLRLVSDGDKATLWKHFPNLETLSSFTDNEIESLQLLLENVLRQDSNDDETTESTATKDDNQTEKSLKLPAELIEMLNTYDKREFKFLQILHRILIGGMDSNVTFGEIIITPEGPLYNLPFAALRDPDTGKYLSETWRIRVAPSLATLKCLQELPAEERSIKESLIVGDPDVGNVMMDGEQREFTDYLESARAEAIVIAYILGVEPLIGEAATKQAVLEKLQQGVSVVHIAAHGNLSKATILLAPSPEVRATKIPDEEDYMLTMADVQQAKVRAQLVVLSCCHSGRGEIRSEGVVGMCRAFLASGARAVVASLWAIDDDASLEFMTIFYGHLKNGKSASTSLQLTMNEMRNSRSYKEPKYWAPFFLMGDDITLNVFA